MNIIDIIDNKENLAQEEEFEELEKDYGRIVQEIRETMIVQYQKEVLENFGKKEQKEILEGYIKSITISSYPKYSKDEWVERIYQDIFGLVFIENYLYREDFEEMNVNAWDDIEVILKSGSFKIPETFNSPEHAVNITRKMVLMGGVTLDEAHPVRDSFIGVGLRITASVPPVVDKEVGATFSLRKLKDNEISVEDLVYKYGSYSKEELDFLTLCLEHGVSVLFGGPTSSGKTSDMQTLLSEIARKGKKRIYTIEENTRELNLIHKNEENKTISRVIHTKTRPSSAKNTSNINSSSLVKTALRYHPDIICPAEMRSEEAYDAVEAALTGHTITSSAHVLSVTKAYKRLFGLCKRSSSSGNDDFIMEDIVTAFPICVFKKQLAEDHSRRCLKIFEATGYDVESKKIKGRILFQFFKEVHADGSVTGTHERISEISNRLSQILYENGASIEEVERYNFSFREKIRETYTEDFIYEGEV